jgi:hypothetical protein
MNIIRPSSLPRFWWVNPWSTVRYLSAALAAMKDYADRADRVIDLQAAVIDDLQDKLSPQQTDA